MVEMKKRMKAILHKRVHSIRESVLRQRNENYAQKFLLCKQSEGSMKSSLRIAFFYRSNNSSVASPSSSFFFRSSWHVWVPTFRKTSSNLTYQTLTIRQVRQILRSSYPPQEVWTTSTKRTGSIGTCVFSIWCWSFWLPGMGRGDSSS